MNHGVDGCFSESPSTNQRSAKSFHHFCIQSFWLWSTTTIEDSYIWQQSFASRKLTLCIEVGQPENCSGSGASDSIFT